MPKSLSLTQALSDIGVWRSKYRYMRMKENVIIIQAQEVFSEYPEYHCLLFRHH